YAMASDSSTPSWRQPRDRAEETRTRIAPFEKAENKHDRIEDRKRKKVKKNKRALMLAEERNQPDGLPANRRTTVPAPTLNIPSSGLRWPILLLRQGLLLLVEGIDARYGLRENAGPESSLHVEIKLSSRDQSQREG